MRWTAVLKRKLLKPKILKEIRIQGTVNPRSNIKEKTKICPNVFVSHNCSTAEQALSTIASQWDGSILNTFLPGQKVLIKINLNTTDAYPASTCPVMLTGLIDLLKSKGISDIVVGDCSSISSLPTKKVAKSTGILEAIRHKAQFVSFDQGHWVKVPIDGQYLKQVTIPKTAMEADRIIFLANLKTHRLADFSFGMKLGVGFVHPLERYPLHKEHLKAKIAELSLALTPDLTIIDGRKGFVDGGPDKGRMEETSAIIWGDNILCVDLEAYRQLYIFKKQKACIGTFKKDPFLMEQFSHAKAIWFGDTADPPTYALKEIQVSHQ